MYSRVFSGLLAFTITSIAATHVEADSQRGAKVFQEQRCIQCHSVADTPTVNAMDLGRRLDRDYTPASIASRMWNHAPVMWAEMKKRGMAVPQVSESQVGDLFAFFYAARYFEKPGDAARGKQAFEAKGCAGCHAVAGGPGKPVSQWGSLSDPVVLIQNMWNHAGQMQQAAEQKGRSWPELQPQELADILVYLQNLPGQKVSNYRLVLTDADRGLDVLKNKGCVDCHKGALALETRLQNKTLTDVAAEMWNHTPRFKTKQMVPIGQEDMRALIAYAWGSHYYQPAGSVSRGKRVFETKKCASCHDIGTAGAPALKGKKDITSMTMVAALWKHGPKMLVEMEQKQVPWPQMTGSEMAGLIAYLNSR